MAAKSFVYWYARWHSFPHSILRSSWNCTSLLFSPHLLPWHRKQQRCFPQHTALCPLSGSLHLMLRVMSNPTCIILLPSVFTSQLPCQITSMFNSLYAWVLSWFRRAWLFVTRGPRACQAPLSHGVLQAKILEGVARPSSRDLPDPGIEPAFLMSHVLAGGFFTASATSEAQIE